MAREEMPIFTKTYDMLSWLLPATKRFPREHRHDFTLRLLNTAFDLREFLEEANLRKGAARMERLDRADEALVKLKVYIRLATKWDWLQAGQYAHVAALLVEVGKLLGGWRKVTVTV